VVDFLFIFILPLSGKTIMSQAVTTVDNHSYIDYLWCLDTKSVLFVKMPKGSEVVSPEDGKAAVSELGTLLNVSYVSKFPMKSGKKVPAFKLQVVRKGTQFRYLVQMNMFVKSSACGVSEHACMLVMQAARSTRDPNNEKSFLRKMKGPQSPPQTQTCSSRTRCWCFCLLTHVV
jgi:hypothetical protein